MNLFHEVRERRVLPAVGVYIGACWVLVEIVDRLVERYFLSPYVTDAVFWGLYSLVPAVILVAWTHGRPGKDKATTAEKVGVPINVIATIGLLITVFGGKDLSATADLVTVDNELGESEQHYIPRESFQRGLVVFFFDDESGSSGDWVPYGVTELLTQDLQQNPFVLVTSPWANNNFGIYARMKREGFVSGQNLPMNLKREIAESARRPWFVDGSVDHQAGEFKLNATVWETESLQSLGKYQGQGRDLLELVDEMSTRVREILDVPQGTKGLAADLPLSETYGESQPALEAYIRGRNAKLFDNDWEKAIGLYDEALEHDPQFVRAWFLKGINLWEQGSAAQAIETLAKAQELAWRLPEYDQVLLKGLNYRISGEQEKQEKLLRMQTKLRNDANSWRHLANYLMLTGRLEESKEAYQTLMERDSSDLQSYMNLAQLERATGQIDAAIAWAEGYVDARPDDVYGQFLLGDLKLESGDMEAARAIYQQAELLETPPIVAMLKQANLDIRSGRWVQARSRLADAEALSSSPQQSLQVLGTETYLEMRLGRFDEAIALIDRISAYSQATQTPIEQVFNSQVPKIQINMNLGRLDEADRHLQETLQMVQPPISDFLGFIEAPLRARQGRFEEAQAAVELGEQTVERFKADYLAFQIPLARAAILEQQEKYAEAAAELQNSLDLVQRSAIVKGMDNEMTILYASAAKLYIQADELDRAQRILDTAFQRDEAEPGLWVARAMLQKASENPQMALASINYALAIWQDAHPDYIDYREALALRDELTR